MAPHHLPPATVTHLTILPVLCPSHLNQTCMKHKEHLFTFYWFIIYAARLMVCLFFCTSFLLLTYALSGNLLMNVP